MSDLLKAATKAAKADEKRMNIIYTPRHVKSWWSEQDKDSRWIKQQSLRLNIRELI